MGGSGFDITTALQNPKFQELLLESAGGKSPVKEDKASLWNRAWAIPTGFGSTMDAYMDVQKGRGDNFLEEYLRNIGQGFQTAFTGKKNTWESTSDVLKWHDILQGDDAASKVANFGVSLGGDIASDPLTWALGTGVLTKAGKLGGLTGKAAQVTEGVLNPIGGVLKGGKYAINKVKPGALDPLGELFSRGYKLRKQGAGAVDDLTRQHEIAQRGVEELIATKYGPQLKRTADLGIEGWDTLRKVLQPDNYDLEDLLKKGVSDEVLDLAEFWRPLLDKTSLDLEDIRALKKTGALKNYVPTDPLGVEKWRIEKDFANKDALFADKTVQEAIERNKGITKAMGLEKEFVDNKTLTDVMSGNPTLRAGSVATSAGKELKGADMHRLYKTVEAGEAAGIVYDKNMGRVMTNHLIAAERAKNQAAYLSKLRALTDDSGKPLALRAKDFKGNVPTGMEEIPVKGLKGWLFPKEVAGYLKNYNKEFITDAGTNKALKIYDDFLRLFKMNVTVLGPGTVGYQLRNSYGDLSNMLVGGYGRRNGILNPAAAIDSFKKGLRVLQFKKYAITNGMDEAVEKYGQETADLYDIVAKSGNVQTSQFADEVGVNLSPLEDLLVTPGTKGKIREVSKKGLDKALAAGNFRENWFRTANVIDHYAQTGSVEKAAKLARMSSLDYANLTPFERNVIKRIIPFYSFMRQNLEFQMRAVMENPVTVRSQQRFLTQLGETLDTGQLSAEEQESLPDWMKVGLNFTRGRRGNTVDVVTGFGDPTSWTEEMFGTGFKDTSKSLLGAMSPAIKIPLELATGLNFFQGRPIEEISNADRYMGMSQLSKDLLGVRSVKQQASDGTEYDVNTMNPTRKYLLENLPLLAPFTTTAKRIGDVSGEDGDTKYLINLLSGARIYETDLDRQKAIKEREIQNDLNKLLADYGVVQPRSGVYLSSTASKNYPELEELFEEMGYKQKDTSRLKKKRQEDFLEKQAYLDKLINNR